MKSVSGPNFPVTFALYLYHQYHYPSLELNCSSNEEIVYFTAIFSISSLNDRYQLKYANFRRCYSAFLTIVKLRAVDKSICTHLEVYCFFLLFQYDLVVSLCNQQKQVIFILLIQLSKKTAPKYALGTS